MKNLNFQASSVNEEEADGSPLRLQFGFSHQLEELVHEKLKGNHNTYVSDIIR